LSWVQATHWPLKHCSFGPQVWQVTPPMPHAWLVLPGLQALFWQQPLGHPVALQTQLQLAGEGGPLQISS